MTSTARRAFIEAFIVWAFCILAARVFYMMRGNSFVGHNLMLLTSGLFIYVPALVLYYRGESVDFFEKNSRQLFYSLKLTFFTSFLVFSLIALGNHFYEKIFFHFRYHPGSNASLVSTFFFHLFLVALPEEFFFRGYFLKRMRQIFDDRFTFLGAKTGKAFFITALVFAFSHSLIVLRWWHFAIFFPALVFGWLREKTNGLTAPILFHALSNLFSAWVGLHYR
ncbi:MAG: CPBP family intramembrane glutamic endopeptidase [bacterium]